MTDMLSAVRRATKGSLVEKIQMEHPDLPGSEPAIVSRGAFEDVWKRKGWTEFVPPPKETAAEKAARVAKAEAIRIAEVKASRAGKTAKVKVAKATEKPEPKPVPKENPAKDTVATDSADGEE